MKRFDIAVIGTGPAGLEAAITAKARNKDILLLGAEETSQKVKKAHAVQNYLGLPDISGRDMQVAFSAHLKKMGVEITNDRANAVYAMGDYYLIQGRRDSYEAACVILACGVSAARPLPGETEHLGRGVSYCATCDAALYKGKTAIVVAYSASEESEAEFLAEMADKVYYLPQYAGPMASGEKITVCTGEKPMGVEKAGQKMRLTTATGAYEADGIFILRDSVAPAQLVPGLNKEENHVAVDRSMKTNLAGLFACGDITGTPYQYIKAAGEGNVAALSAVSYLAEQKLEGNNNGQ